MNDYLFKKYFFSVFFMLGVFLVFGVLVFNRIDEILEFMEMEFMEFVL